MSEKKFTGISKILRELKWNGSSLLEFETDDNREITPQVAGAMVKKSKSTTYRYLSMLVETGYVEVNGSTNNSVYRRKYDEGKNSKDKK